MSGIVFVGQGPNQTAWKYGVAKSTLLHPQDTQADHERWSERYCARVAITGSIGEKLARMLEMHRLTFYRDFARRNLNSRWNGKSGKGDAFNKAEAKIKAAEIAAEGFKHFVLLGNEAARAFGQGGEPLKIIFDKETERDYLLFPHPSGINAWWNEEFNRFRAAKRLREFIQQSLANPQT